jgi:hypothetical protein
MTGPVNAILSTAAALPSPYEELLRENNELRERMCVLSLALEYAEKLQAERARG